VPTLVLLRHGESEWNSANRFTGWVDVDLTARGEQQARHSGELLREAGLLPDVLHTSVLTRAVRTGTITLEAVRPARHPDVQELAAQRALLRCPAGAGPEGDARAARGGAVPAVAAVL